jgi:hypothetical protein
MATISRLYDTYEAAADAVRKLLDAGIPHSDISLVSNNADNWYSTNTNRGNTSVTTGTVDRDRDGRDDRAEGAEAGAGIGGVAGGIIGLLTGLGLMAIPGVGPVVAAGWLASTAAGVAAGGAAGGIIGALTQTGASEEDASAYAEGIRRGGTLVTARVPDTDRARYEAILDRSSVNIRDRGTAWRNEGWQKFDPNAGPYTADQVRRARETHRSPRSSGLSR